MKVSSILSGKQAFGCPSFLLLFALLLSLLTIVRYGACEWGDTMTYLYAWDAYISHGKLDPSRTPVYPILLGLSKFLVGQDYYKMVVVMIQHVLSILSIVPFYKTAYLLTSNKKISLCITICYIFIADATWNSILLTESIACSCIVFVTFYSVKLLRSPSKKDGVKLFAILLMSILLRPAQIYILPVIALIFAVVWIKTQSKASSIGLLSCVSVCLFIGIYIIQFKNTYGYYGISNVSDINQYYILRTDGILSVPNEFERAESDEKTMAVLCKEIPFVIQGRGYRGFHDMINNGINEHKLIYITRTFERFNKAKDDVLFNFGTYPVFSTLLLLLSPHISFVYILLLFFPVVIWIQRRNWNVPFHISCLSYLFLLSNVLLVVVGAPNDWGRLLYPSIPAFLFIVIRLIHLLALGIKNSLRYK